VHALIASLSTVAGPSVVALPTLVGAGDPGSTRLVYAMVGGLVLIGICLVVLGIWLVRQTRYDPPVLAPLERMGDSSWRKRDLATQQRILDELRPEGAEPLAFVKAPPTLDAEFELSQRPVESIDDLGPGIVSEGNSAVLGLPVPDPIPGPALDSVADPAPDETEAPLADSAQRVGRTDDATDD